MFAEAAPGLPHGLSAPLVANRCPGWTQSGILAEAGFYS